MAGDERVEGGILEHPQGKRQPVASGSPRPASGSDSAHLTSADGQPSRMERAAERYPWLRRAIPGEFDQFGLLTQQLEAASKTSFGGGGVENKIIFCSGIVWMGQFDTQ